MLEVTLRLEVEGALVGSGLDRDLIPTWRSSAVGFDPVDIYAYSASAVDELIELPEHIGLSRPAATLFLGRGLLPRTSLEQLIYHQRIQ